MVSASAAAQGHHRQQHQYHRGGWGGAGAVLGLTVYEVLEGVWRELQKLATNRDFYNEEMGTIMTSSSS